MISRKFSFVFPACTDRLACAILTACAVYAECGTFTVFLTTAIPATLIVFSKLKRQKLTKDRVVLTKKFNRIPPLNLFIYAIIYIHNYLYTQSVLILFLLAQW